MGNSNVAEDLRFMRSMIERTQRQIDPGAPIMIVWGIICLIGYCVSHFLIEHGRYDRLTSLWLVLYIIGISLSGFFGYRMTKNEIRRGIRSHISKQIGWVWAILVTNGIIWSWLVVLGDPFFLWAILYGVGLSMMGILYGKEWLVAGIGVLAAISVAALIKTYAYIILGIAMGLGCIVPGIFALIRIRKWVKQDAKA